MLIPIDNLGDLGFIFNLLLDIISIILLVALMFGRNHWNICDPRRVRRIDKFKIRFLNFLSLGAIFNLFYRFVVGCLTHDSKIHNTKEIEKKLTALTLAGWDVAYTGGWYLWRPFAIFSEMFWWTFLRTFPSSYQFFSKARICFPRSFIPKTGVKMNLRLLIK